MLELFISLNGYIYTLIAVVAAFTAAFFALMRILRKEEGKIRRRIKNADHSPPIETESPVEDPSAEAQKSALQSVHARYTVIRHVLVTFVVLLGLLAAAFPLLGTIPATMLSALLATFGIVIGIVAKPVLENLVAGLMLTLSRAINVSDTVIFEDRYGTIEDVTATHTVIKLWDWRRYVVPNARVMATDFTNLTLFDSYQWARVDFWVAPDTDLKQVEQIALDVAARSRHLATHEPPHFWVYQLGKDAIHCWLTAWADNPSDAWDLKHEVRMNLSTELRNNNIRTHFIQITQTEFSPKPMS